MLHSRARNTAFDGRTFQGHAMKTFVGGECVFDRLAEWRNDGLDQSSALRSARLSVGAISFGLLVTRLAGLGDVRQIGSGNIGATNVLRTGKKWAAALTLLLDGGKGAVAVLLATVSPELMAQ